MELTKFAIIALLVTAGYLNFYESQENHIENPQSQLYTQFQEWKLENGFVYETNQENSYRFSVFISNLEFVLNYNFEHGDEYLGLTSLSGLTNEEYQQRFFNDADSEQQYNLQQATISKQNLQDGEFPMTNDWVAKGAVGPVYDAGGCNGSWAIGAAEALTGIYQIRGNPLTPMSPQQIIDCDTLSAGCRGGSEQYAYIYSLQNGIMSETSYPFTKRNGNCVYDESKVEFHNEDALEIRPRDADLVQQYSLQQPLTARIDASDQAFQQWRGKEGQVYHTMCPSDDRRYTVLIVGYNDQSGTDENGKKIYPYYTIKASFGTKWGKEGYMNIYKKPSGTGQCGLYERVTFPGYGI